MAGGLTTTYQYVNGPLLGEERSDGTALRFTYDPFGALSGIQYKSANGSTTDYYVRCTLNGDVDQIYDTSGNLLARYIYDSWGRMVSILNGSGQEILTGDHIAVVNPIRYRGYYYDGESGLYYLQSRYYDAKTGRFLNADSLLGANDDCSKCNLFAYCGNNPINNSDPTGNASIAAGLGLGAMVKGFLAGAAAILGMVGAAAAAKKASTSIASYRRSAQTGVKTESVEVPIVDERRYDPEPLYFGAQYRGNSAGQKQWETTTPAMTLEQTKIWIDQQEILGFYGKQASWGVYTPRQQDALLLATEIFPDGILVHTGKSGEYNHFHNATQIFRGRYKHFHIWYGALER